MLSETKLRKDIIDVLTRQGFKINPHVRPSSDSKRTLKRLQRLSRIEQLAKRYEFISSYKNRALSFLRNGTDIDPKKIALEIIEVEPSSTYEDLFRWWNLVWWSIPYQRPFGRQMRFILWDSYHDCPFGLIGLQSPVLKMAIRDTFLKIPSEELHTWINMSMHAQRVGALPPFNQLLGGKMVALALSSNEIRSFYREKYADRTSEILRRKLDPNLLFITTASAFGRSSIYNRLKYEGFCTAIPLGFTQGAGSFHIPESVYNDILAFLSQKNIDTSRGFGHGPSRKLKLISRAFSLLHLNDFEFHGIRREFYLFPLVGNLSDVISCRSKPSWLDYPFSALTEYWKNRWCIPRAERTGVWKGFHVKDFRRKVNRTLREVKQA